MPPSREQIAIEAPSPEQIFDIAAPYFAWNAESWHKATQGTIGMPGILNYTRAILESVTPPAQGSIDTAEFWDHVIAYCKGSGYEGKALVAYIDARIAPAPVDAGELPPLPLGDYGTFHSRNEGGVERYSADQMHAFRQEGILADRAARQSAAPDVAADLALMIEHVETLEQGLRDNGCEIVTDEQGNVWVRNVRAEEAEKAAPDPSESALTSLLEDVPPRPTIQFTPGATRFGGAERSFCERCGKRLGDLDSLHTCTPEPVQRKKADMIRPDVTAEDFAQPVPQAHAEDLLRHLREKAQVKGFNSIESAIDAAPTATSGGEAVKAGSRVEMDIWNAGAAKLAPPSLPAASDAARLNALADQVVLANATGNERLQITAISNLLAAIRALISKETSNA